MLHATNNDTSLKVSKFQKQIVLFSFEQKNERNYFLNSALASKMSQIKKMKALYYSEVPNKRECSLKSNP